MQEPSSSSPQTPLLSDDKVQKDQNTNKLASLFAQQNKQAQIDDWIAVARGMTSWQVLRMEEEISTAIIQLKRCIEIVSEHQKKMMFQPVFHKIALIGAMEQSLSSTPGFACEFMKLLAVVIEEHITENGKFTLGCEQTMKDAVHDLAKLTPMKFGNTRQFPGGEWGHWSDGVLAELHLPAQVQEVSNTMKDEEIHFQAELLEHLEKFSRKHKTLHNLALHLPIVSLKQAARRGRYGWLRRPGFYSCLYDSKRKTLPWTVTGICYMMLIDMGVVQSVDAIFSAQIELDWNDLVVDVLPSFTEKTSTLLAVLEYKKGHLATMRAKILAAGMSAGIAGAQILAHMATQWFEGSSEA